MINQGLSLKKITTVLITIYSGVAMAIEEPKYVVKSKTDQFEIRSYDSTIVAETFVDADFDNAGNAAFRILADYIFGNNTSKTKIEMTAPVTQQNNSEKISMTAPVTQSQNAGGHLVQFTMPANYTMQTLPIPNDSRVVLREILPRTVAVFSYSGSWSETHYNEKLEQFKLALDKNNIKTVGKPVFARFNSPFQIWFLRRNEIWIEIQP